MNWVLNSRVYKNSKFKEKILASANDPINKELIEQVNSYVDSKYVFKLQKELEEAKAKLAEQDEGEEFIEDENEGSGSPASSRSSGSKSITHTSSTPLSFTPSEDFESDNSSDGVNLDVISDKSIVFPVSSTIYLLPIYSSIW